MKAKKAYKDKTGNVAEINLIYGYVALRVKRQSCISEHTI
jgi:hypothetical protein